MGLSDMAEGGTVPYNVYVIELRREVLEKARFARKNPELRDDKPCVYVGQTALAPEDRFAQHLEGRKCNPFVREFGVRLRPKLYANVGPFETRAEAERAEVALAERLRRRGYVVWSN